MTLEQIQAMGILLCVMLAAAALAYLPLALHMDARDAHLLHEPGTCAECDAP